MMKKSQQGATLIVVLILLVALTIVGTLAIRQSIVSLNIATNGQAQQLLMQNSDAATFNIENADNLKRSLAGDGMIGFIRGPANVGKEMVFCYRGSRAQFFTLSQASIVQEVDGNVVNNAQGTNGFCRSSASANFFTSQRRAVLTQVSVSIQSNEGSDAFQYSTRGTDEEQAKAPPPEKVVVNTISLMPTLSTADTDDIDACLSTRVSNTNNAANRLSDCLRDLNVPFTTHVSEYSLNFPFSQG